MYHKVVPVHIENSSTSRVEMARAFLGRAFPHHLNLQRQCSGTAAAMAHLPIEEQTLPCYSGRQYYPMKPGQILQNRYRTVAKLGFGAYSTVWLGVDERFALSRSSASYGY